jgi:hypothetical protein
VIEQLRKVAREQWRGVRPGVPSRSSVTPTVERQDLGFVFQSRDDTIPDAAIERKRVNQRSARRTWFGTG